MHITLFTDYSLRTLMYLAVKKEGLSTIQNISDTYQISKNHLMKVVQKLNALGYVFAVRGKHGGLRLNQEPEMINVGQLVQEMEQDSKLLECFGDDNRCVITPACQLKIIMAEAMQSFYDTLEQYTLADLINPENKRQIMQILIAEPTT